MPPARALRAITSSRPPLLKYGSPRLQPLLRFTTTRPPVQLAVRSQTRAFSQTFCPQFQNTPATMVVNALKTRAEYDDAIKPATTASGSSKLVVIDCFATWCGPCNAIAPKVAQFSEQYSDVAFYKVDVDDVPDVAQELGVRAMPTFVFFKNGEKVDEVLGAVPPAIEAAIKKHQG